MLGVDNTLRSSLASVKSPLPQADTVDVGDAISVTYAEAFLTVGYIVAIFTWEFVNSTSSLVFLAVCAIY